MNQKPKNKNLKYLILTFGIIILFALMFIPSMMNNSRNSSTSYSDFLQQVEQHEVEKVTIEGDTISFTTDADDHKVYVTQRVEDPNLVDRLIAGGVEFTEVPVRQNQFLDFLFNHLCALSLTLVWLMVDV